MVSRLVTFYKNLPGFVKNIYFLTTVAFVVWMLFFDSNNVFSQIKRYGELRKLETKRNYYQAEIERVRVDHDQLFGSDESKERFAREKYWMKKENEDVFIIVEK